MPWIAILKKFWWVIPVIMVLAMVNHWRVKASQLDEAKAALSSCVNASKRTKEANDELQKNRDAIASKLAAAKRLHPNTCLQLTNAKQVGAEYAGRNGIETDWLRDYAAQCETYRTERITLEKLLAN